MSAKPVALTMCDSCRFWQHGDTRSGFCRRHAPAASDRTTQVARWPETRAIDGCGEGEMDAARADILHCRACVFWQRPGVGIDPTHRGDHAGTWWQQAGWCRRFAPVPDIEIGTRAFWRVTHEQDYCFDGSARRDGEHMRDIE